TAAALYHKALAPELQRDEQATLKEVQAWALEVYATAWEKRESLADAERDRIIGALARYTGVPPSSIDRTTLAMTSPQFTSTLLKDRGLTLGRYDMRIVSGPAPSATAGERTSRSEILLRYFREDLEFRTDLAYQGL